MADVLDKIRKLIALATNAGAVENEARNAAMMAVKLIVEHGVKLTVVTAGSPPPPFPGASPRTYPTPTQDDFISAMEEILRGAAVSRHPPVNHRYAEPTPRPSVKNRSGVRDRVSRDGQDLGDEFFGVPAPTDWAGQTHNKPVVIISKWAGRCHACRSMFDAGEQIYWVPGVGGNHRRCGHEGL